MSMTSGSTVEGHNLPQGNRCIILSPSFNLYIDVQAWHRTLRRGQLRKCYLHILVLHGTYEDHNFFIQDRKLNDAESVLNLTDEDDERARTWTEERSYAMVSAVFASRLSCLGCEDSLRDV
jgi:SNF2 family DNA or RNA helicase